jgi:hypothetical protein
VAIWDECSCGDRLILEVVTDYIVCPFARLVKKNDWALPQVDEEGDVLWPSPLGGFRERERGAIVGLRRARGSALLCVRERGQPLFVTGGCQ